MGYTWEVYAFGPWDQRYQMVHRGESAAKAMWAAWRAKRAGAGCVKVEWR